MISLHDLGDFLTNLTNEINKSVKRETFLFSKDAKFSGIYVFSFSLSFSLYYLLKYWRNMILQTAAQGNIPSRSKGKY